MRLVAERRRDRILLRNIISGGAGGEASERLRDQDVPLHQNGEKQTRCRLLISGEVCWPDVAFSDDILQFDIIICSFRLMYEDK